MPRGWLLQGLAFNSAGDLFEADEGEGLIYKFTPDGAQSTFASGLGYPVGLAFQPVPEPATVSLVALGLGVLFMARRLRSPMPSAPKH